MKRPKVITNCVASNYAGKDETIIEIVFPSGKGCLIMFYEQNQGAFIQPYRLDDGVFVNHSQINSASAQRK